MVKAKFSFGDCLYFDIHLLFFELFRFQFHFWVVWKGLETTSLVLVWYKITNFSYDDGIFTKKNFLTNHCK